MTLEAHSENALLLGLKSNEIQNVLNQASLVTWKKDQFLFREGDPAHSFFLLKRGRVQIRQITDEGNEVLVRLVWPGDVLGTAAAILPLGTHTVDAQAAVLCQALVWSDRSIQQLMRSHFRLSQNICASVIRNLTLCEGRLRDLATQPVERRIGRAIADICPSLSRSEGGAVIVDSSFRRLCIAKLAGTTTYSVSRILSNWRRLGILGTDRRQIVILRPESFLSEVMDAASVNLQCKDVRRVSKRESLDRVSGL